MKLRDQARGRTIPPARSTGPPSTGYKPEEDYLGDEAQLLYLEREKNPQPFGDRPLFVLAAGKRPPPPGMTEDSYKDIRHAIDQDRAEAAHLSRNSKFVLDVKSGHDIQIDDPKAVAEAVEEVVAAVKNQTKLADITVPSAGLAANVTSILQHQWPPKCSSRVPAPSTSPISLWMARVVTRDVLRPTSGSREFSTPALPARLTGSWSAVREPMAAVSGSGQRTVTARINPQLFRPAASMTWTRWHFRALRTRREAIYR